MNTRINSSISITERMQNSIWTKLNYQLFGKGPQATAGVDGSAFLYVNEESRGKKGPELQLSFFSSLPYFNPFNLRKEVVDEYLAPHANVDGFSTALINTRPRFREELKLKSSDPFDYPSLNPRYLSHPKTYENLLGEYEFGSDLWKLQRFKVLVWVLTIRSSHFARSMSSDRMHIGNALFALLPLLLITHVAPLKWDQVRILPLYLILI